MNTFLKIAKAGAIMFAVGIALAAAAPYLAGVLAPLLTTAVYDHAVSTPVLWTGAFFGSFGAIHATITPVADWLDGTSKKAEIAQAQIDAHIKAPCCEQSMAPEHEVVSNYFQHQENERRAAAAGGIQLT